MDKFLELTQQILHVFGLQAERVWPKVVYLFWLQNLVEVILFPIILVVFSMAVWKLTGKAITGSATNEDYIYGPIAVVTGIFFLLFLLVCIIEFPRTITALIDPEAAYIRYLFRR